jgi:hypothetical protein
MTATSTPSLMDQIYYVYHDETYMQINLTTQPRTPERNKKSQILARNVLKGKTTTVQTRTAPDISRTVNLDI